MANIRKNKELLRKVEEVRKALNGRVAWRGIYPKLTKMSKDEGLNNGKGYHEMTIRKTVGGSFLSSSTPALLIWIKEKVDEIDRKELEAFEELHNAIAA